MTGLLKRLFSLMVILLSGCTLNVSLTAPLKPFDEQVVEGKGRPKIIIADLSGILLDGIDTGLPGIHKKISHVSQMQEILRKAEEDGDVAGVILRINSPGGSVAASDIIYHEIAGFRQRKKVPVYACITDVGASGAYYVASASDRIIAHPSSITGSIGVIAMKLNIEGLLSKIGVEDEVVKSGDKKDFWSPFRAATTEEKAIMQGIINHLFNRFIDAVLARRGGVLTREELLPLADGRIYTADEALRSRLIDDIGYLDDVIRLMKKSLAIKEARVVTYYRPGSYKPTIYSGSPYEGAVIINLFSIDPDGLLLTPGIRLMYLWAP